MATILTSAAVDPGGAAIAALFRTSRGYLGEEGMEGGREGYIYMMDIYLDRREKERVSEQIQFEEKERQTHQDKCEAKCTRQTYPRPSSLPQVIYKTLSVNGNHPYGKETH